MNKEQVLELLKILNQNDCLHSEWKWWEEDENNNLLINEDNLWVVELINDIIIDCGQSRCWGIRGSNPLLITKNKLKTK